MHDMIEVECELNHVEYDLTTVGNDNFKAVSEFRKFVIAMNHVVCTIFKIEHDMIHREYDILHVVRDSTSAIVDLSQRFADLKKRLAEVEAERVALKQEIQNVQEQLAAVVPPAFGTSTRTQVLWVLRRDDEHACSPLDICRKLGRVRDSDVNAVRLVLGRLTREGKVTRISHGRYRINQAV